MGRPHTQSARFHKGATAYDKLLIGGLVNLETGCIEWTRGKFPVTGYGQVAHEGKQHLVHRLAYETFVGEIPKGMHTDHLCRNVACFNTAHLEVVTSRENILRGIGPSAVNAAKTHCKHGHPLSGENLVLISTPARPRVRRECRRCRSDATARCYAKKNGRAVS